MLLKLSYFFLKWLPEQVYSEFWKIEIAQISTQGPFQIPTKLLIQIKQGRA